MSTVGVLIMLKVNSFDGELLLQVQIGAEKMRVHVEQKQGIFEFTHLAIMLVYHANFLCRTVARQCHIACILMEAKPYMVLMRLSMIILVMGVFVLMSAMQNGCDIILLKA